ncbi:MAG: hypothetical protein GXO33_06715 [Epsilonproteobacteria bacterium]|nr:hypothetical protein [Campylobacterota bacterium]
MQWRKGSLVLAGLICTAGIGLKADDARLEARQRISPIVSVIEMSNNAPDCGLKAGNSYTLEWKIIAYGEDYTSTVAFFDCTSEDDYECGNSYDDANRLLHTSVQQVNKRTLDDWTYTASNGEEVNAYEYTFVTNIDIPSNRDWEGDGSRHGPWNDTGDGGNKIVIRFYQVDDLTPSGAGSISILIGARTNHHYGFYGRRVYNYVAEDTDSDNGICPMR